MRYPRRQEKIFILFIALTGWFALALQLYILIRSTGTSGLTIPEVTGRFFTYFTILTNLLTVVSLTILLARGVLFRFFSRPSVQTAIAIYIFTVGLGYNLLLRHLWKPEGLQLIADELLHDAVPLLYTIYWFVFVYAAGLKWKQLFSWLPYPVLYAAFAITRGAIDDFYAYPFINVKELGYKAVALNLAGLLLILIVISCLFIATGKWKNRPAKY